MKRFVVVLTVLAVIVSLMAACGGTPAPAAEPALVLKGQDSTSLTMEDLKKMPAVEGWAGIKNSTGRITPPSYFKGVALKDLCAASGSFDETMGANVVAKDGYAISFSYEQITRGGFVSFDPGTGEEIKSPDDLTAILAYEVDGQPLDETSDGALRLVIVSSRETQVTDGHWSVKWVTELDVRPMSQEWTLKLMGAIEEDMDRATFESCSAPKCHGVTWTDEKAQEWAGTPLWRLAARVDDENKHDTGAYDLTLAEAGYTVEVVASDGYKVELDSRTLKDSDVFVAVSVNGNALPDNQLPLRLVGRNLDKSEMVGGIAKIHVLLPESAPAIPAPTATAVPPTQAPEPTAAAAEGGAALSVTGAVDKPLSLSLDGLKTLGVAKITAEHPKKGPTNYEGVRLCDVLKQASPKADASKVIFAASDGFLAEIPLATVNSCADCLIAVSDSTLGMVMPGLDSSAWTKGVVTIEVK